MAKMMNMDALQANIRMIDKKSEMAYEQARSAGTLTPQQEKLAALMADESFVAELLAADTAEEAQALLKGQGVDMTVEEITAFAQYAASISRKLMDNGGEITEEELEQIAGGVLFSKITSIASTEGEDMAGQLTAAAVTLGGVFAGGYGGFVGGMALGSMICPGPGTVICGIIGLVAGEAGSIVAGVNVGYALGAGVAKGVKKLGKLFKRWF